MCSHAYIFFSLKVAQRSDCKDGDKDKTKENSFLFFFLDGPEVNGDN